MKTIWKYELAIIESQTVLVPIGSRLRAVQAQDQRICAWAEVESENAPCEARTFFIRRTGHSLAGIPESAAYLGTVQLMNDRLVFHVFVNPAVDVRNSRERSTS